MGKFGIWKWGCVFALALCQSGAYAWNKDKPPGAPDVPEATEAQLQAQQNQYVQTQPEIGTVPQRTEEVPDLEQKDEDSDAANAVATSANAEAAAKVIVGSDPAKAKPAPTTSKWLIGFLAALAVGIVGGLNRWLKKSVPKL